MIKLMDLLNEYKINSPYKAKVIEYGDDVMDKILNFFRDWKVVLPTLFGKFIITLQNYNALRATPHNLIS